MGRISFTIEELMQQNGSDRKITQVSLSRLASKGEIALIRRGFYVIITPEFSLQKRVPPILFIDDLMKYLNKDYYVSLLSAAALHGAGHQQPMLFSVTTDHPPLRDIERDDMHIAFQVKQRWDNRSIMQMKTRTGYVNVSTPETTVLDIIENQSKIGLGRATDVIGELSGSIHASPFHHIASQYPTAIVQRLGYILDSRIGKARLTSTLSDILDQREVHHQHLSLSAEKKGELIEKWKIIVNDNIQTDL